MKEKISNNIQIKNKRATFDYELLDTFTAGIVLTGTEIKSIRLGKASLVDTFCIVEKGELWVKNMYIAEYFTSRPQTTAYQKGAAQDRQCRPQQRFYHYPDPYVHQ